MFALCFLTVTDCPSCTAVQCPPSVIGPSLLLLPILGTVCPQHVTSAPCMCFPMMSQGFPLQVFLPTTHDHNFCSMCAVTVVIFWTFKSFFLLSYLLTSVKLGSTPKGAHAGITTSWLRPLIQLDTLSHTPLHYYIPCSASA